MGIGLLGVIAMQAGYYAVYVSHNNEILSESF
jgi:hypothetical protein